MSTMTLAQEDLEIAAYFQACRETSFGTDEFAKRHEALRSEAGLTGSGIVAVQPGAESAIESGHKYGTFFRAILTGVEVMLDQYDDEETALRMRWGDAHDYLRLESGESLVITKDDAGRVYSTSPNGTTEVYVRRIG